jgi:acid phosphatase type 7
MAAGDIACQPGSGVTTTRCRHRQTSNLLGDPELDAVLVLGDSQYEDGEYPEFTGSGAYAATWGRKKAITRPTPGNHEYHVSGASGYFDYFGGVAGDRGKGYYSFDLGSWHLIALNSEISTSTGSTQEQWLRNDLRTTGKPCILAYWHRPRFSSGSHGGSTSVLALWRALHGAGADVVLSAHDHDYERFALQNPSGQADAGGIREFVVGTGGASHSSFSSIAANSQVRNAATFGVLKLTLRTSGYEWKFVPEAGGTFTDSGSTRCH